MKILFDTTALCTPRLTSTGNYVKYLAHALVQRGDCDVRPVFPLDRWKGGRYVREHLGLSASPFIPGLSSANLGGAEVFHGTAAQLPRSSNIAKVVTVHDMIGHRADLVSALVQRQRREEFDQQIVANQPAAIIAPTQFVRDEIAAFMPSLAGRVVVVPHGADHIEVPRKKPVSPFQTPYILFIGTGERRKNAVSAALAFAKFAETNPKVRLVVVGMGPTAGDQLRQRVPNPAVRERIEFPGFITTEMLTAAYMNALGLFFPSFYEGFCFPILEAMRLYCPVVTSRVGAMLELAGDAALLTDPRDITHMAEALRFLAEDRGLCADLVARGKERSSKFTWKECAEQTVAVYRNAAAKGPAVGNPLNNLLKTFRKKRV